MLLPDIDLLQSFVWIYERGTVSAAADTLGRSQAAISMRLKKLEELAGHPLFSRTHHRLVPTAAGQRLFERAKPLLLTHAGLAELFSTPGVVGRLRIGLPDDYALSFFTQVLQEFGALHPNVELEIVCSLSWLLAEQVAAGELDLALVTMQQRPRTAIPLRLLSLVWAGATHFKWSQSDPLPIAVYPDGCAFRALMTPILDHAAIPWRIAFVSRSSAGIQSSVRSGLAVTAMAQDTLPSDIVDCGEALGLPPLGVSEVCLLRHTAAENAATERMEKTILRHFGVRRAAGK